MKFQLHYLLCIIFPLYFSNQPVSGQIPDLTRPGTDGYLVGELIYSLDNRPTPECHASTIVEIPGGVLAAWFGGTEEKHKDVGIWISRRLDGRWSDPVEVVNGVQNEDLRYPCWNPILFQPEPGPLMLFYKVGPSPSEWWGMLTTSEDYGLTWSEPRKLGKSKLGHLVGPDRNKPYQLADGTILCMTATEREDKEHGTLWRLHVERTTDLGKTWEVSGPLNDGIEFDAIQPGLLVHRDGRLQILCRSRQGKLVESWSNDQGKTWSPVRATSLPNPNAGTDAVTLKDGRHLLVYNHAIRRGAFPSGREILNVALSRDGHRWTPVLTLEKQKGEYSYPAVIQDSDGYVHITYTYRRRSIKHVVIDPRGLPY